MNQISSNQDQYFNNFHYFQNFKRMPMINMVFGRDLRLTTL